MFFAQAAGKVVAAVASNPAGASTVKAPALVGYEIALWTGGGIVLLISAFKLIEWILAVAGLTKSSTEKMIAALADDRRLLHDLHGILTDKVFAREQEGRFDDITKIKAEIDRVMPYMKTPPAVESPLFLCRAGTLVAELQRIGSAIDALDRNDGELEKQMSIIVKLLQAIATDRSGKDGK